MRPVIYFIRHGETDWNAERRFQGQADTDLNERGRAQADRNGERLASLVGDVSGFYFVASPLKRSRQTMEHVRLAIGMPAFGYATDPRLLEVNFGDWQGRTIAEIETDRPGSARERAADKWGFCPPGTGGESYRAMAERFRPWLEEIARPTVCVAHGGILRAVLQLRGAMTSAEAAMLEVPQDRILRCDGGTFEWL